MKLLLFSLLLFSISLYSPAQNKTPEKRFTHNISDLFRKDTVEIYIGVANIYAGDTKEITWVPEKVKDLTIKNSGQHKLIVIPLQPGIFNITFKTPVEHKEVVFSAKPYH